jgi:hypothetical protein
MSLLKTYAEAFSAWPLILSVNSSNGTSAPVRFEFGCRRTPLECGRSWSLGCDCSLATLSWRAVRSSCRAVSLTERVVKSSPTRARGIPIIVANSAMAYRFTNSANAGGGSDLELLLPSVLLVELGWVESLHSGGCIRFREINAKPKIANTASRNLPRSNLRRRCANIAPGVSMPPRQASVSGPVNPATTLQGWVILYLDQNEKALANAVLAEGGRRRRPPAGRP